MVTWGSNTTTVFGTSTPAAGAAPTAAPSTGFNFGAPAASTPAAPSTPPRAPSGFSFGAAPAPSAPAPAPSGGLFGAPAPTAPSGGGGLFGSSSAPAPAPSGGGLFGASTPAPFAASGGGGLFGSTPAPSAAPTPSFGAFSSAPAPSAFPTAQAPAPLLHPHQAAYHAHQSAAHHHEAARLQEALLSLHSQYSPVASDPLNPSLASNSLPSSMCRFTAMLYDPLPPSERTSAAAASSSSSSFGILGAAPAIRAPKPPHVSNRVWNEALARNPDPHSLVPTPLVGAAALHSRLVRQQEQADKCAAHAKTVRETLRYLEKEGRKSKEAIECAGIEQEGLRRRLLEVMRKVEIVRCMGHPLQRGEVEAVNRLGEIVQKMRAVERMLGEVEERGTRQARVWRMRASSLDSRAYGGGSEAVAAAAAELGEEEKYELFKSLNEQMLGNETLGQCVKRDVRDVEILKEEMERRVSAPPRSGVRGSVWGSGVGIFGRSR
ncbi:hypothetical protein ACHAXS_008635 [Conticribra weissflogii]